MGVVCPGERRRRARAAFGSLSHEGQESGPCREKGVFERKAEKQRSRDEDRRALESGQKTR